MTLDRFKITKAHIARIEEVKQRTEAVENFLMQIATQALNTDAFRAQEVMEKLNADCIETPLPFMGNLSRIPWLDMSNGKDRKPYTRHVGMTSKQIALQPVPFRLLETYATALIEDMLAPEIEALQKFGIKLSLATTKQDTIGHPLVFCLRLQKGDKDPRHALQLNTRDIELKNTGKSVTKVTLPNHFKREATWGTLGTKGVTLSYTVRTGHGFSKATGKSYPALDERHVDTRIAAALRPLHIKRTAAETHAPNP